MAARLRATYDDLLQVPDTMVAWIVDPELQTLEIFRGESDGWHLVATHGENEVVRVAPFAEIEIELALLWGASLS